MELGPTFPTLTIPAFLARETAAHGTEIILRKKDRGIWNALDWSTLNTRVSEIGQGLLAAGLTTGMVVAIVSETRPELVFADLAVLGCGGVSLAIHPETEAAEVADLLRRSNTAVVVVEGEEQLDKGLGVRAECPTVQLVVIIDVKGLRDFHDPQCMSLADLIVSGTGQSDWNATAASVQPGQAAVILTGADGGLYQLTHADILRQVEEAGQSLAVRPGDERLAVLPMSDPTERILGLYLSLKYRIVSNYLENPETATENLREVKPTVFGADAEAWERLHARTTAQAGAATMVQKAFYHWAVTAGAAGGLMAWLANLLVLPAVRSQLGFGQLRVAYIGDRAVPAETDRWARALGITVRLINPFKTGGTHV